MQPGLAAKMVDCAASSLSSLASSSRRDQLARRGRLGRGQLAAICIWWEEASRCAAAPVSTTWPAAAEEESAAVF